MSLQYASYLECQSPEDVRQVFKRACVHLPSKVQLHLEWAAFEERQGAVTVTVTVTARRPPSCTDCIHIRDADGCLNYGRVQLDEC